MVQGRLDTAETLEQMFHHKSKGEGSSALQRGNLDLMSLIACYQTYTVPETP